ncbi:MAG: hypothetical protein WCP86_00370 [bacterium]
MAERTFEGVRQSGWVKWLRVRFCASSIPGINSLCRIEDARRGSQVALLRVALAYDSRFGVGTPWV